MRAARLNCIKYRANCWGLGLVDENLALWHRQHSLGIVRSVRFRERQGFFARGKVLGLALMRDKDQTAALIELLAWYREMGVTEAVAEIGKLSGYPILLGGDMATLANRKITLELPELSFWEALDQFCVKAEMTQQN